MIWQDSQKGIYHSSPDGALYCGHSPDILSQLPDAFVQVVVTSPPYYGLRNYGLDPVIWGGDRSCEHDWGAIAPCPTKIGKQGSTETRKNRRLVENMDKAKGGVFCRHCRAWKGCLGNEQTPQQYVRNLVSVFSEVWRVLRDDGVVWLNIGDTYAANRGYQVPDTKWKDVGNTSGSKVPVGLKPKDLCLVPERLAIALQEAGWFVRCIIPWIKINAMCSSQKDRPTVGHEYFLLLTKESQCFFDLDAVKIKYTRPLDRWAGDTLKANGESKWAEATGQGIYRDRDLRPDPAGRTIRTSDFWYSSLAGIVLNETDIIAVDMPTRPYKGAHYASFSEDLIEPMILAGSSAKACSECRSPWERVKRKVGDFQRRWSKGNAEDSPYKSQGSIQNVYETIGFRPTCECYDAQYRAEFPRSKNARKRGQRDISGNWWKRARKRPGRDSWETGKCIVLDPFMGTGTTCAVAKALGRQYIGIDAGEKYCDLALERLAKLDVQLAKEMQMQETLRRFHDWRLSQKDSEIDAALDQLELF